MGAVRETAGVDASRDKKQDFPWARALTYRQGAPSNLEGIDVFFDFNWEETIGHRQTQFKNGLCLARRVKKECPNGKRPALLLTETDQVKGESFESKTLFVVVVNISRYLVEANADASAAYFGDASGPGLTRMSQINAISRMSANEMKAFLDLKLTAEDVAEWASSNGTRISALREIVEPSREQDPLPVAEVIKAIESLGGFDEAELADLSDLFSGSDGQRLVEFINENGLLPADLARSIEFQRRRNGVDELEAMLTQNLTESP
jgi:hypothetical protein